MKYIFAFCLTLISLSASATSLALRADSAYNREDYADAIRLYNEAIAGEGVSSNLYYNLGNAYYRDNRLGKAILSYERALALDPSNEEAATNLEFVRTRIEDVPEDDSSFLSNVHGNIVSNMSPDAWAWTALVLFIIVLGTVALYIFSSNVTLRKVGFFGGFVLLALCIIANVFASVSTRYSTSHDHAVVIDPSTLLSTSPRVPKDRSEEAMLLHEGTCVEILDSVTTRVDSTVVKWYDVKVDNSHRAWINGNAIAII